LDKKKTGAATTPVEGFGRSRGAIGGTPPHRTPFSKKKTGAATTPVSQRRREDINFY